MCGPFRILVEYYLPFRIVFYDFFTQVEMDWITNYTRPKLSSKRRDPQRMDLKNTGSKKAITVEKAVQTWFNDVTYNEKEELVKITNPLTDRIYESLPMKNPYGYKVENNVLIAVSRRIEYATNLNITTRYGSASYQATHYGLGGSVEAHMDPWGYESGNILPQDRLNLVRSGDYIATFMGWLDTVNAGGGTMFHHEEAVGLLKPIKGAAAFWINLKSCHMIDYRTSHGGCPVLMGSKWILNKWIYSWDQWKVVPCKMEKALTIDPYKGIFSSE